MIYTAILISLMYGFLVLYLSKGIERLSDFQPDKAPPENSFSIIVPFRNEEANLPVLLESIVQMAYPKDKFELIMINDDSSDNSAALINSFKDENPDMKLILINNKKNSISPKKEAVEKGISKAAYHWIVTTDADCSVPKTWLSAFDHFIRQGSPKMIVAPVTYFNQPGFLHKFQLLDFLSLQGTTMGIFGIKDKKFVQPFLCNGANLCYQKDSFNALSGFEGNHHIPSGDDVFLLEKMLKKYPKQVEFIKSKESIVKTSSKTSFGNLLQQRIRWASKTTAYDSNFAKFTSILVFVNSLLVCLAIVLGILGEIPPLYAGFIFLIKFNVDFILLFRTSKFFDQEEIMKSYFLSSLVHPFYTVLVVFLSLKNKYTWKERTY